MARKVHHYRRSSRQETPELDMTTFMNLMVVLVPFLLVTAVFSRITVVELDLPSSQSSAAASEDFKVEVVVRDNGLEIMDGHQVIAAIPNVAEGYDLATLSGHLVNLKQQYPDKRDASVLLEPDIAYDHLIQVMDTMRTVRLAEVSGQSANAELFTAISVGDAP